MEKATFMRKRIRITDYDYSTVGVYFITFCVKDRKSILWTNVAADTIRQNTAAPNVAADTIRQNTAAPNVAADTIRQNTQPQIITADIIRQKNIPLSVTGKLVEQAIRQIPEHYPTVTVDKYCIMPDHVHLLLSIQADAEGHQQASPPISTVVGMMKRWVSKQIGYPIWQKSYIDRVIRNEKGYRAAWEYIDNNPIKLDYAWDNVEFF